MAQTSPKFERFEIDIDAPRTDFFAAIEHIEIIRLEETQNSLVPSLRWYFKTPNGFGVPIKKDTPYSIALFDVNGNYKNVINNYGRGPKEFRNISDVWFNNGKIELFSGWSRKLHRYSETGEYIETIKAGYNETINGGEMMPYKGGYIFEQINPSSYYTPINYYGVHFTDKKLNTMGKDAFINDPKRFPANGEGHLSQLDQAVFYRKPHTDTVYQVIDAKVYPRFKFDFGEQWLWSDPKSNKSMNRDIKVMLEGKTPYDVLPYIGQNYIVIGYRLDTKPERKGIIDRGTGKFSRFDMRKEDKEDYDMKFLEWEGDRLVGFIAAYDFEEFVNNLDDNQWTVKGGFAVEEIFESENPVLLKIKFKE